MGRARRLLLRDRAVEYARLGGGCGAAAAREHRGGSIHGQNLRNFLYRSESDFDERWETRSYDLAKLDGHDFLIVYWGMESIAHTMVSFRFRDESKPGGFDYLAISIEARKEKSEAYSPVAGAFRRYELYYVIADERDVVGVRTNYRRSGDLPLSHAVAAGAFARHPARLPAER